MLDSLKLRLLWLVIFNSLFWLITQTTQTILLITEYTIDLILIIFLKCQTDIRASLRCSINIILVLKSLLSLIVCQFFFFLLFYFLFYCLSWLHVHISINIKWKPKRKRKKVPQITKEKILTCVIKDPQKSYSICIWAQLHSIPILFNCYGCDIISEYIKTRHF